MLEDRAGDHVAAAGFDAAHTSGIGVQPVRLMPAVAGGAWCIPVIHESVPTVLTLGGESSAKHLASFGLAGHSYGVPLPDGRFTNVQDTLTKQWHEYILRQLGEADPLTATLVVKPTGSNMMVLLEADSSITVCRLKPMVDALNEAHPGMGWFVVKAIESLHRHRFPVYSPSAIQWLAEYCWYNGFASDEALAEELRYQLDEDDKGDTIEELKEHFGFPWPSDLVEAFGGHEFLLHGHGKQFPKAPSRRAAAEFARSGDAAEELRECVRDALAVLAETGQNKHPLDGVEAFADFDEDGGPYDDEFMTMGATCAVVWDDPAIALEAIEHYEQLCMESSEGTTIHMMFTARLDDEAGMRRLVAQTKAMVRRYALASKLLLHFTTEE